MADVDSKSSLSFGHLGIGALIVLVLSTLFGLRSDKKDSKPAEKSAASSQEQSSNSANSSDTADEPHRKFISRFLPKAREVPVRQFDAFEFSIILKRFALPAATDLVGAKSNSPAGEFSTRARFAPSSSGQSAAPHLNFDDDYKLDTLIVTAPDPIDTPFGTLFDHVAECVGRAIDDTGAFEPVGYYYPWEDYLRDAKTSGIRPSSSWASSSVLYRKYPGVLMFRRTSAPKEFLAVLLVGETPRGIHFDAMKSSLDLAAEAAPNCHGGGTDTIRLIAPFFTGSLTTVYRAIYDWQKDGGRIHVQNRIRSFDMISGSANGFNNEGIETLNRAYSLLRPINLKSTIAPNESQMRLAVDFLKNGHHAFDDREPNISAEDLFEGVALLTESNTAFGRSQDPLHRSQDQQLPDKTGPEAIVKLGKWPLILPFPLHLARLHDVAESERRAIDVKLGTESNSNESDFGTKWDRPRSDTAPSMNDAGTSELNDHVIDELLSAIRRNRAEIVGITATDPKDVVFLTEKVKAQCPDVELFTTGADVYYTLPENASVMRGVAVASTYPLVVANEGWTRPRGFRWQAFKNETGVGYYNATTFHIRHDLPSGANLEDHLIEYRPPLVSRQLNKGPPIWVAAVSFNGGYVPFGYREVGDNYPRFRVPEPAAPSDQPGDDGKPNPKDRTVGPGPRLLQFGLIAFAILVYSVPVLFAARRNIGMFTWIRGPRSGMTPETLRHASVILPQMLLATNLALVLIMLAWIGVLCFGNILDKDHPWRIFSWFFLAAFAFLAFVLVRYSIANSANAAREFKTGKRWSWPRLTAICVMALLVAPIAAALFQSFFMANGAERLLFFERSSNLVSGYSVLFPFLMLLVGFWFFAYFGLKYVHWSASFRPSCPLAFEESDTNHSNPGVGVVCDNIKEASEQLTKQLDDPIQFAKDRMRWLLLLALMVGTFGLIFAVKVKSTWESFAWDFVFALGIGALFLAVVFSVLRLWSTWKLLEELLNEFALVPFVSAFDRLPRKIAGLFSGYFFGRRARLDHLVVQSHILRQLLLLPPEIRITDVERTQMADLPDYVAKIATKPKQPMEPKCADETNSNSSQASGIPKPSAAPMAIACDKLNDVSRNLAKQVFQNSGENSIESAFGGESTDATRLSTNLGPSNEPAGGEIRQPSVMLAKRAWLAKAEELIAIQTIIYLSQFFFGIEQIVITLVGASVCLFISVSVYPFEPERLILYLTLGLLALVCGSIIFVMYRVNKNEIFSRITKLTPNQFDWNWGFVIQVLVVLGPIALVAAARFSGGLRAIFAPLIDSIR